MSAAENLERLKRGHKKVIPIFRKTGPKHEGADAFSRARDIESVMDAFPEIIAVVKAAEQVATTGEPIWGTSDGIGFVLQDALSALDEKLGDVT